MGAKTGISWTDHTWNFFRGCSKVSAGCDNCYAITVAHRYDYAGGPYEGLTKMQNGRPNWTGRVMTVPAHLDDPWRWPQPSLIFTNSMADVFHPAISDDDIAAMWAVMAAVPRHRYQVLTKRPERMQDMMYSPEFHRSVRQRAEIAINRRFHDLTRPASVKARHEHQAALYAQPWPLPQVWLGVSAENQTTADQRLPILMETPAAVRFLSAEPLLGPIELTDYLYPRGLDWVITGGESGPGYRAMDPAWARDVRDRCVAAGVAYYHKQGSGLWSGRDRALDGRVWDEFPALPTVGVPS